MSLAPKIRIGILETGIMSPEQVARHGTFASWFERILSQASGSFIFDAYRAYENEIPPSPSACNAYIVTGSPSSVLDSDPWIQILSAFLIEASTQVPIVGVCFGHQLLHQTFDGKVEKSSKGWGIGVHEYHTACQTDWMEPVAKTVRLCASHSDQVVRPAPNAAVIAGSAFCPNAITMIGPNILTIQGHPDYTKDFAGDLYLSRRERMGFDLVSDAMRSLNQPTDEEIVSGWIARFISSRASQNRPIRPQDSEPSRE